MKKSYFLILILLSITAVIEVINLVFARLLFGSVNPWEIVYSICIFLSAVLFAWSIRVPMHAKAAYFIGFIGILIKFLTWGFNQISAGGEALNMFNGILNIVIALVVFASIILSLHTILHIYKFENIVKGINVAFTILVIVLIITTSIYDIPRLEAGDTLAATRLVFEKLALLGVGVIGFLGNRLLDAQKKLEK